MDRFEDGVGVGDVDLTAGEDGGEGVEVQVPACGGGVVLDGLGDRVREVQEGVVALGVELPGEGGWGSWVGGAGGAPGGGDLEEAGWVELADGAVEGGGVAVPVGVEPAQREPAPVDEVQVGLAPPPPVARRGR
jgi:hypothetical protein